MHKELVNGVEVRTNYREKVSYPMADGSRNLTGAMFGESDKDMLERLVADGYTKVTFYEMATSVRGYHKIYASCR